MSTKLLQRSETPQWRIGRDWLSTLQMSASPARLLRLLFTAHSAARLGVQPAEDET